MPHFHLKKLTWKKEFRISIVPFHGQNKYVISIWDECSVCGYKRNFVGVDCSSDPEWVMVY